MIRNTCSHFTFSWYLPWEITWTRGIKESERHLDLKYHFYHRYLCANNFWYVQMKREYQLIWKEYHIYWWMNCFLYVRSVLVTWVLSVPVYHELLNILNFLWTSNKETGLLVRMSMKPSSKFVEIHGPWARDLRLQDRANR